MKVKFKNGTIMDCDAPTEQKIFKAAAPAGEATSLWVITLGIKGSATSDEIDITFTPENIAKMVFLDDEENELFTIQGYERLSSSTIRHSENIGETKSTVQITKEGATSSENLKGAETQDDL